MILFHHAIICFKSVAHREILPFQYFIDLALRHGDLVVRYGLNGYGIERLTFFFLFKNWYKAPQSIQSRAPSELALGNLLKDGFTIHFNLKRASANILNKEIFTSYILFPGRQYRTITRFIHDKHNYRIIRHIQIVHNWEW